MVCALRKPGVPSSYAWHDEEVDKTYGFWGVSGVLSKGQSVESFS
jgi:hypothetical protein